jgi:hypothetical protein
LSDLLAVAVSQVSLELRVDPSVQIEVVSAYPFRTLDEGPPGHYLISIGDLLAGDERHIVVRLRFPGSARPRAFAVEARLHWSAGGSDHTTMWRETQFEHSDDYACDAEPRDATVMRGVGLHHAERARQQATVRSRQEGPTAGREILQKVRARITEYAGDDPELQKAISDLDSLQDELSRGPIHSLRSKEITYQSYRSSRSQRDFR